MTAQPSLVFGDIEDTTKPLAVLVHGFPDTPHTWRHLGPVLADGGYRVATPWLPGYLTAAPGPIDAGSYVRHILDMREFYAGDQRTVLIGHDWGALAAYGAVVSAPSAFHRLIALAVPPTAALGSGLFRQLKRSFYIWFIQQVGLADAVLLEPGFWESLWSDWSPGYQAGEDVAMLREHVTADTIGGVVGPYRASFNPQFADPNSTAEAAATMGKPTVATYYLHGSDDGAIGSELLEKFAKDPAVHLPAAGSTFELIDGVGHFLHLERPEILAAKILAWLAV